MMSLCITIGMQHIVGQLQGQWM